jgi:hypothetical protein
MFHTSKFRPKRRSALVPLVATCLVACSSSTQAQLAAGSLGSGGWSMWTTRDQASDICLEIRAAGRETDRLCGLTPDNGGMWRPDAPPGDPSFVAGTLDDPAAASARAVLADGTRLSSRALASAAVSPLRFYVMVLPAGATLAQIDYLDPSGAVVTSLPGP